MEQSQRSLYLPFSGLRYTETMKQDGVVSALSERCLLDSYLPRMVTPLHSPIIKAIEACLVFFPSNQGADCVLYCLLRCSLVLGSIFTLRPQCAP